MKIDGSYAIGSFFDDDEIRQLESSRRAVDLKFATIAYCVYENPFAKSGGIFAVADNYAKVLVSRGRSVVLLTPFHSRLESAPEKGDLRQVGTCEVPYGNENILVTLFEHVRGDVRWILFQADGFFQAEGTDPYIHDDPSQLLTDSLFASATIPQALASLGITQNVIYHLQDWELAATALCAKEAILEGMLKSAAIVLTSHNPYDCRLTPKSLSLISSHKYQGKTLNTVYQCMIPLTDAPLSTVSKTFAAELRKDPLQTTYFTDHLQNVFREQTVVGVDNGLFGEPKNPFLESAVKKILAEKKSKRQIMLDMLNDYTKEKDFRIFGYLNGGKTDDGLVIPLQDLPDEIPVFMMFGRLDQRQKGFDVLASAIRKLPRGAAKCVLTPIVGGAPKPFEQDFQELADSCAGDVVVYPFRMKRGYMETMAGATFAVMPSLYEPFGGATEPYLQGTPVVARATGGLVQQVVDVDEQPQSATGILYREPYQPGRGEWRELLDMSTPAERQPLKLYMSMVESLESALLRAVNIYNSEPAVYARMLANLYGAATKFSWNRTADEYEELYKIAVS